VVEVEKCVLGIDIGGSTTKITGYLDGKIFSPMSVRSNDPKASVYGAFGKFISENNMELSDISKVMITGVGSHFISGDLFGVSTKKTDEFVSIGRGGLHLSGLDNAVVVSLGTGTAIVYASSREVRHIGGTGIGGGTLLGLSNRILKMRRFNDIVEVSKSGDLTNIDLKIKDITPAVLAETLRPDTTASNFGKISDLASGGDLALGIINMILQTIGVIAAFACKTEDTKNIVLTGYLANLPQTGEILPALEDMYRVKFIIPDHAEYATATGAAIISEEA